MALTGKVALVTGGATGIGKAIVERFVAEGAGAVIDYLPQPQDEDAAQTLAAQLGPSTLAVAADVTRREDVDMLVERTVSRFGRLDIAVSNAGIEIKRPFLEVGDDEWQRVLAVNLYGGFVVSQVAARRMVQQGGGGRIIFVSSVHEDIPFAGYAAYCVSKGGLRMLMRNLALELAPYGITVNGVAPGAIATPINASVLKDPAALRAATGEIPLGRFGEAAEVAGVVAFLAGDDARYVTGSSYRIDGGLSQQVTSY